MGVSTDAILCLGIAIPEGYEFPWNKKTAEDFYDWLCADDWWLYNICKYKPSFELYDERGNRLVDTTDVERDKYIFGVTFKKPTINMALEFNAICIEEGGIGFVEINRIVNMNINFNNGEYMGWFIISDLGVGNNEIIEKNTMSGIKRIASDFY